jgi:quinoprotein glucose dehydrogenase
MGLLLSAQVVDPRRWVLAAVLGVIAVLLIAGGIKLISLGGSPYYVIAGLLVLASAYFTSRGDARGRTLYLILLIGTLIWALVERGTNGWGLQARLFAPAVLGLWVFWPWFRDYPRVLAGVVIVALAGLGWLVFVADGVSRPSAPSGPFENSAGAGEWHHYGNDLGGQRYAALGQITPDNVGQLKEAWRMETGGVGMGFEATPLFVKDTLYICTPTSVIIAIDPDTGKRRWTYDSKADVPEAAAFCRGVAYYAVPGATGACAERIYMSTVDARLVAVDARDGKPCADFGENGIVDLGRGLGPFPKGYWHTTSAPEVIRGNVIFNSYVLDNQYVGEPSGVIRAFDAVTGKLAWAWDMDNPDNKGAPPDGQVHSLSTANSWGPIAGDEELGLVYLPMGNTTPDYFGAGRSPASEKYSSGIVALDATTGEVRWHYQITHHDIWDYDVAAQPTLVDFKADDGSIVPAVIQQNKRGETFVFDRRNGRPLTKVEEKPVPQGPVAGEWLSPTQPFSTGMPAFDRRVLAEQTMWGMTPLDQLWCRIRFREMRWDGPLTPPGLKPNLVYPSYSGGVDWAGVSVDPVRHLMVVNWLQIANYTQLIPRAVADAMGTGVPKEGKLQDLDKPMPQKGTPYAVYAKPFWSPLQVPCTEPPYGSIAVVNLDTREIVWQKPLGNSQDSGPFGLRHFLPLPMGTPNQGGSVVTKSGLIFIAAAQEQAIRALDLRDGRKLWSARLPAGGQATPMTFISPKTGKQYVVIAAGGNFGLVTKLADYVIAYALP